MAQAISIGAHSFEFKVRKPLREDSLDETVAAALQQIRDKNYDAALIGRGFDRERIRHYRFAFEGKLCKTTNKIAQEVQISTIIV